MFFSLTKEGNLAICDRMNVSEECYAKSKKFVTEEKVLHDFTYMHYLK